LALGGSKCTLHYPLYRLVRFLYLHYRGRQPHRPYCADTLCLAAYYPQYLYGHYAHQPAYYRSCRGIALAGIASFVGAGGIDQRPDIINNKERFGDWEIDTIVGAFNKGAIVTLTERTTKMLLMKYLPNGKEAKGLAKAVIDLLICYLFLYL